MPSIASDGIHVNEVTEDSIRTARTYRAEQENARYLAVARQGNSTEVGAGESFPGPFSSPIVTVASRQPADALGS
jgi:hypothetical protein